MKNNKKRFLSALLVLILVLSFGGQVFAMTSDSNIMPRGEVAEVPSYRYTCEHYDGAVTVFPIVYRRINIPSGFVLQGSGPELVYFERDAYYNGVKYATVYREEWSYSVVPE